MLNFENTVPARASWILLMLMLFVVGAAAGRASTPDLDGLKNLRFRTIGPAVMSGRIVDFAVVESDPKVFFVASATGGVWKTVNNGVTFTPVFEREGTHSVGDIAVHQKNPDIVWVGTGERANRQSSSWGDGVYKSMDGGRTWRHMGLKETRHIGRIVLHPQNTDIVYVAAMGHLWGPNEERGLYRTRDGGETWEKVLSIDLDTGVVDVVLDHEDPSVLYAAAYQRRRTPFGFHGGGPGSGLYKSTDGGETWKKLTSGLPGGVIGRIGIDIYRRDTRIVYACFEQGLRYAMISYEKPMGGIYRSEDKGETWTHMGTWNPRPMYASQILIDPNDDRKIYMQNRLSVSEDGGKTFRILPQNLNADDRILWINPRDSRHLLKGDDGGVAVSYDGGEKWLFIPTLPVSQFYRLAVDGRKPFYVYGGTQDNGTWAGPSATRRSEGVLNEDWIRIDGADGFQPGVHGIDQDLVITSWQYLGLNRYNLESRERQAIRPGDPQGHIRSHRNWETWLEGKQEPELGNSMPPANWDAPYIISAHEPDIIYAATDRIWKSEDFGLSWEPLQRLTGDIKRRELTIMGRSPAESTPSLDDGTPFYPTVTALAESPLRAGLLAAGTDDGLFWLSKDGGVSWENLTARFPGLPQRAWFNGIEFSRFHEGILYVVVNNYRNDDYGNYLYKTIDGGASWTSITAGLPAERVLRTLREDPRSANLLYLGTELGLFVSFDAGATWNELKNNLPTAAFNDLLVHPRDNDLVLATHGRGIWILDNLASLQELTPDVLAAEAHLFSVEPAEMIRYNSDTTYEGAGWSINQGGDAVFKGENPPRGAVLDYYLKEKAGEDDIRLEIQDAAGKRVTSLEAGRERGLNRVVWKLRHPGLGSLRLDYAGEPPLLSSIPGPFVVPGTYTAVLEVKGRTYKQSFPVIEDSRIETPPPVRARWTETLLVIGGLYERALKGLRERTENSKENPAPPGTKQAAVQAGRESLWRELARRILDLYNNVSRWTGEPTRDQKMQLIYYGQKLEELEETK